MHSIHTSYSNRYSAKNMVVPINFTCFAPKAKEVYLMGDFNNWDDKSHPMDRRPDGAWATQIPMNHGHHHYQFLIDGVPTLDPRAQGIARNAHNQRVSMIAVS
jgi:1,4-alpha-glucan branching enzyme